MVNIPIQAEAARFPNAQDEIHRRLLRRYRRVDAWRRCDRTLFSPLLRRQARYRLYHRLLARLYHEAPRDCLVVQQDKAIVLGGIVSRGSLGKMMLRFVSY